MALTRTQQEQMIGEAFDPNKVTLWCAKHSYFGPVKGRPEVVPNQHCSNCWRIWFIHELTQAPPDKREEKLAEMEEVMFKMVEMVEKGTWDFKPYEHAQIEFGEE